MARIILVAQDEDDPFGVRSGDEDSGEEMLPLKEPSLESLKPAGGEPPEQFGMFPRLESELEGLPGPMTEEPPEYRGLEPKEKAWIAVTQFNPLWIRYVSLHGRESERTLSMFDNPKAGIFWGRTTQQPYITAWDDMRNNWSRFRVQQIMDAKILPRAS